MFLPNINNVCFAHSRRDIHLFKGRAAQTITCRNADACLTADTGAESSISAWSHTLVEISS